MERIIVFSDCSYFNVGLSSLLNEVMSDVVVHISNPTLPMNAYDLVILLVNEQNLLRSISFLLDHKDLNKSGKVLIFADAKTLRILSGLYYGDLSTIRLDLPLRKLINAFHTFNLNYLDRKYNVKNKSTITSSELEVIQMLLTGLSLTEIARLKKRSVKTISHQKCSFFRKLGLQNRLNTLLWLAKRSPTVLFDNIRRK